jgi:hypothetical protein
VVWRAVKITGSADYKTPDTKNYILRAGSGLHDKTGLTLPDNT